MKKGKKLFHKLLDIVMDKEPESGASMNVSSLEHTAEVWIMEMVNGKCAGVKAHYSPIPDSDDWYKWVNGLPERVSADDVLEALRNA